MKNFLLLAVAVALTTSAALAQTVAPGTSPGAQTGNPSNMPSAGTPSNDRMMKDGDRNGMTGTSRDNDRMMRKGSKKMKTNANGTKKMKSTM